MADQYLFGTSLRGSGKTTETHGISIFTKYTFRGFTVKNVFAAVIYTKYMIFINIVPRAPLTTICTPRIFSGPYNRCRPDLLLEWVPLLCPELVKRSLERPLVSGFYRLVTLVFRETARAGYFDPPSLSSPCESSGNSKNDTIMEVS